MNNKKKAELRKIIHEATSDVEDEPNEQVLHLFELRRKSSSVRADKDKFSDL